MVGCHQLRISQLRRSEDFDPGQPTRWPMAPRGHVERSFRLRMGARVQTYSRPYSGKTVSAEGCPRRMGAIPIASRCRSTFRRGRLRSTLAVSISSADGPPRAR